MDIRSEQISQDSLILFISGRLDTASSPAFESKISKLIDGKTDVIFDLQELSYISSSGLHVLLLIQKTMMANNRKLVLRNVNGAVKDVFEMTGFSTIVTLV